jgi:hypothetical protein
LNQSHITILLDELDHVDPEARKRLQRIWNLGHKRDATIALKVGGRRKLIDIHAPMLAAGIGGFLAPTQKNRTFVLEMEPYTEETRPELEFDDNDTQDLNAVYVFLRHWAARVNLDPKPVMPPGVVLRFADNVKGLLAIADSCSEEWGSRARAAVGVVTRRRWMLIAAACVVLALAAVTLVIVGPRVGSLPPDRGAGRKPRRGARGCHARTAPVTRARVGRGARCCGRGGRASRGAGVAPRTSRCRAL